METIKCTDVFIQYSLCSIEINHVSWVGNTHPHPQLHTQNFDTIFNSVYSAVHLKYRYDCNLAKNACKLVRMYNL